MSLKPEDSAHEGALPEQGSSTVRGTLAILGAGQLAQMLLAPARRLGYRTRILADSPDDPAAPLADQVVYGKATDHTALSTVFHDAAWVAIESELIDPAVLAHIAAQSLGERLRPRHDVIARFSDKLLQKKGLLSLGLPTLAWEELETLPADLGPWTRHLATRFPGGYVLKWTRGGYDGHGVFLVAQPEKAPLERLASFVQDGFRRGGMVYAEELCPFVSEVAVVAVRSACGALATYPVVVTKQDHGICAEMVGPASSWGIASAAIDQAIDVAQKVGAGFDLVGTFAVEFFLRKTGENTTDVAVNEIAPRVHNSGHYTQDAAVTSQFENHWRGLLGEPLGSTDTAPYFAMLNILGPLGRDGAIASPSELNREGIRLHWYGKKVSRPRRKLGHVNIWANSRNELELRIALVRTHITSWGLAWVQQAEEPI